VSRLWLAFVLPWRLLFDGVFAAKVKAIDAPPAIAPPPPPVVPEQKAEIVRDEPDHTAALQLLALLQREGRLVDFLREDMAGFSDADIGAAARVVHQGCARALAQHIELEPIRSESEGAAIELPVGYDAAKVRVTGNVAGEPPYRGTLAHHGWRAKAVRLPTLSTGHDARIVAPAEVEVTRA
jgi:hypothetical protein